MNRLSLLYTNISMSLYWTIFLGSYGIDVKDIVRGTVHLSFLFQSVYPPHIYTESEYVTAVFPHMIMPAPYRCQ